MDLDSRWTFENSDECEIEEQNSDECEIEEQNSDEDEMEKEAIEQREREVKVRRKRNNIFYSLISLSASISSRYISKYLNKQKTRVSRLSGWQWVQETLVTPGESYRIFRMEPHVFRGLCSLLVGNYGLTSTREMCAEESLAMFLWTCAHNQSNRNVQNRFKHSGEIVSRKFGEVLDAIVRLSRDIVKPPDYNFTEIPNKIQQDSRFWPHFKGCIGAIDGTHVKAMIRVEDQVPFRGRKGFPTQNVMVVCNFDMIFTFVMTGWPGSTHDARVFTNTLEQHKDVFPHPPNGKYYLVDAGYPNIKGYLAPYKGERYHIPDFRHGSQPMGYQEVFNHAHACLRNVIERSIGVWKNRFEILSNMRSYSFPTQRKIVAATIALHNYIRQHAIKDKEFDKCDHDPNYMPEVLGEESMNQTISQNNFACTMEDGDMVSLRDSIAFSLMES